MICICVMEEARKAGDYDLLGLADLFVQEGHGEMAEGLIGGTGHHDPGHPGAALVEDALQGPGRPDSGLGTG
jgi:hypothetical protein